MAIVQVDSHRVCRVVNRNVCNINTRSYIALALKNLRERFLEVQLATDRS